MQMLLLVCNFHFYQCKRKCFSLYYMNEHTALFFFQKETSAGVHVFLEDTSSNGTFINGEKVGKVTDTGIE